MRTPERIRLLVDLPISKKHGASKGKEFDVTRLGPQERHRKFYFTGEDGSECAAYSHECEIIELGFSNETR